MKNNVMIPNLDSSSNPSSQYAASNLVYYFVLFTLSWFIGGVAYSYYFLKPL